MVRGGGHPLRRVARDRALRSSDHRGMDLMDRMDGMDGMDVGASHTTAAADRR
jgi:hypothetical protein